MNNAEQILVIIVSSVLTVLLILLIVGAVYVIKVMRQLKRITARAEQVADSVESAADMFSRSAGPIGLIKLIASIVEQAGKSKGK